MQVSVQEEHDLLSARTDGKSISLYLAKRWLFFCACMVVCIEAEWNVRTGTMVHVAMCPGQTQTQGMVVVIRSMLEACNATETTFHFHLITTNESVLILRESLSCLSETHPLNYSMYAIDRSLWPAQMSTRVRHRILRGYGLQHPLNFARFFMDKILCWREMNFEKVFYIDTDCVIQSCIAPLYRNSLNNSSAIVAAATRSTKISNYARIDIRHPKIVEWNKLHRHKIDSTLVAFNAGVLLVDLRKWQEWNVLADVLYWIEANQKSYVYSLGSNPPLLLALAGRVEYLDASWNTDSLGQKSQIGEAQLKTAKVLHWTGPKKPWKSNAFPEYRRFWQQFRQVHCE